MMDTKKQIFLIIGVFILITTLSTTYALFSYSRTGNSNVVQTGQVNFSATENGVITLTNVVPITSEEAQTDTINAKTMTISIVGNTDNSRGLEYLITTTDLNLTVGGKEIPVKVEASVSGLGTVETGDYYTAHTSYGASSKYKILTSGDISERGRIMAGYIAPNSSGNGVNGTITIKAYVDADKILISDTYNDGNTPTPEKRTPIEKGSGKEVFTTSEWSSITALDDLSFRIKVEANDGIWIHQPVWAVNVSYDDTNINFNCSDFQCAMEELDGLFG